MKIRLDHPVTLAVAAFLVTAALLGATQVHAHVMQIADDGSVQTRAGVGVVSWDADDAPDMPWPDPATSLPSMPAIPAAYAATVHRVAAAQGISPALLEALIWQESRWRVAGAGGQPGSFSTIHANSPVGALEQLALMMMQAGLGLGRTDMLGYAKSVIDVVVQLDRQGGQRGIAAVVRA